MAINKKLIHFEKFENFNSKKLSANKENTKYTLGVNGSILTGDPEILYQSIVYIKDTKQQWTHGLLYNGSDSESLLKTYTFLESTVSGIYEYTITQEELEKIQNADIVYLSYESLKFQLTEKKINPDHICFYGYDLSLYPNIKIFYVTILMSLQVRISNDDVAISDFISDFISDYEWSSSYVGAVCEEIVDGALIEIMENIDLLMSNKPIILIVTNYDQDYAVSLLGPYIIWDQSFEIPVMKYIGEYNDLIIECVLNFDEELTGTLHLKPKSEGSDIDLLNYTQVITYQDLKTLKETKKLVPGKFYCINDYTATTKQDGTRSANKVFGVVIQAITDSSFSHDALAVIIDSTFDENLLNSWIIKYDFNNDTTRYVWADPDNGKGVIYYMKDEFNNEAWYDFKNIQFLRTEQWFKDNPQFTSAQFTTDTYFYTFSRIENGSVYDDSLYTTNYHATDNHLGRSTAKITKLNNTIFIDVPNDGVYGNTIADGHSNNTFGAYTSNNIIGPNFSNNIINQNFQNNTIGNRFQNNIISGIFVYNFVKGYCYDNRFNNTVSYCNIGARFQRNNFLTDGSTSHCTFGSNINWVSDIPPMINVTFDNNVITGNNSIYLRNIPLTNGENALTKLYNNSDNILFTKKGDEYNIINLFDLSNISDFVYDLGSFDNNAGGENAANNINIIRNPRLLFLRYYNNSTGKYVLIQQTHTNIDCNIGEWSYTLQYIYLDGRIGVRKCWFLNVLGTYQTVNDANHTTQWQYLKDDEGFLYSNGEKVVVNKPELKTLANNAFNNQANTCGYYGTLANYGFTENYIDLKTITVYDRGNNTAPSMFMNVLIKYNNQWIRVYVSEYITLKNTQEQKPITFNLYKVIPNFKLSKDDYIAITFINDNANAIRFVEGIGLKTISISGGISSTLNLVVELSTNPTIASNWAPAMSFEYYAEDFLSVVHLDRDEVINGIKTFNHKINTREIVITDTDGDKTVIRNNIDNGEFKVTRPNSDNGFIIRTNSGSTNSGKQQLEMLTTNGSSSYTYKFPFKDGIVALTDDLPNVIISKLTRFSTIQPNIYYFLEDSTITIDVNNLLKPNEFYNEYNFIFLFNVNLLQLKGSILFNDGSIPKSIGGNFYKLRIIAMKIESNWIYIGHIESYNTAEREFSVNHLSGTKTYKYTVGMTWGDWLNSSYKTEDFSQYGNYITSDYDGNYSYYIGLIQGSPELITHIILPITYNSVRDYI